MDSHDKLVSRVREALTRRRDFEEKRMFGGTAFMLNGKMCIGTMKDDLVVRVGPEQNEQALAMPNALQMDFTGRPMKGFVFVGTDKLTDAELEKWLDMSISYVSTLKKQPKRQPKKKNDNNSRRR
jgi:hypothetical protein